MKQNSLFREKKSNICSDIVSKILLFNSLSSDEKIVLCTGTVVDTSKNYTNFIFPNTRFCQVNRSVFSPVQGRKRLPLRAVIFILFKSPNTVVFVGLISSPLQWNDQERCIKRACPKKIWFPKLIHLLNLSRDK